MKEPEQEHPEITKGRKMYARYKGVLLNSRRLGKLPKKIKEGIKLERVERGDEELRKIGVVKDGEGYRRT